MMAVQITKKNTSLTTYIAVEVIKESHALPSFDEFLRNSCAVSVTDRAVQSVAFHCQYPLIPAISKDKLSAKCPS